jgi:predicted CXXCH cytochrome family protein
LCHNYHAIINLKQMEQKMKKAAHKRKKLCLLVFTSLFTFSLSLSAAFSISKPANAASPEAPNQQAAGYAGSDSCTNCHANIHEATLGTRHAQAFSSPIFQRDWSQLSKQTSCLECHTTGYDPDTGTYSEEGVKCEACHGPFQPNHPTVPMSITPDAELCSKCHKTTTDEWRASKHSQAGIQCQACHNPHSQTPKADSVTDLCTNCHKEPGESFTHGTHANAGLECSNCHMYTAPRVEDPIQGLVPTGHTFSVGSEACIGCHQDTVHTRNEIIKLSGEVVEAKSASVSDMEKTIQQQNETIGKLEASSSVRLYTGLIQGAIVGLATGGAAAWVVSRRIKVIEVDEND